MNILLESEYLNLNKELSHSEKVSVLSNIIQIKSENKEFADYYRQLSIDIKEFIIAYIDSSERNPYRYDRINSEKFFELIKSLEYTEQITYIDFFIRKLQNNNFNSEIKQFFRLKYTIIINEALRHIYLPKYFCQFLLYFPLKSTINLFLSILSVLIIYIIVLLPAIGPKFYFFSIEYSSFSENKIIDHLLMSFSTLLKIDCYKIELNAITWEGVFLSIVGKIFLFLFISNYLLNKVTELLKR